MAWLEKSEGAYQAARRNGWFKEATSHMPNRAKPRNQ